MPDDTTDPVIAAVRRDLRPAPGAKAATWAGLQARIEAGESPRLPAAPQWTGTRAPFWIGVAIAAAAAVLLVTWIRGQRVEAVDERERSQAIDDAKARTSVGEATARRERAGGTASTVTAPPAEAPAKVVPTPGAASPTPAAAKARPPSEVELVVRAREALVDGDAARALTHAREAGRRFPSGTLAIERGAIEVRALCRLGRVDEARTSAEAVAREHAGSEVAAALARAPCE